MMLQVTRQSLLGHHHDRFSELFLSHVIHNVSFFFTKDLSPNLTYLTSVLNLKKIDIIITKGVRMFTVVLVLHIKYVKI